MKKVSIFLVAFFVTAQLVIAQNTLQATAKKSVANSKTSTIKGTHGWLFLKSELNHLSKGKFYGAEAKATSECKQAGKQDPIPAIVNFNDQLKEQGITLLLMPVPPKGLIYNDKITGKTASNSANKKLYKDLFSTLKSKGIQVVDLIPTFEKNKAKNVYCKQDSHWSTKGIELASKQVANKIKKENWYASYVKTHKVAEKPTTKKVTIAGDLWKASGKKSTQEIITIKQYPKLSQIDKNSPVLVMGDSHTLVFHSGEDMLAKDSGLAGVLASKLGFNLDLIGVKGSGTTSVRIDLYRKAKNTDWLQNKKVIVWCFTARDFSESTAGWRKVPVVKK